MSEHDGDVWRAVQDCVVLGVRQPFASSFFLADVQQRKTIENRDNLKPDSWYAVTACAKDFDFSKTKWNEAQVTALKSQMQMARRYLEESMPLPYSMLLGFIHVLESVKPDDLEEMEERWMVPGLKHWRIDRCIAIVPIPSGRAPQKTSGIDKPSMSKLFNNLSSIRVLFDFEIS